MSVNETKENIEFFYGRQERFMSGYESHAVASSGNISFLIRDPFARYLEQRENEELEAFLTTMADAIRAKLREVESRLEVRRG